MVNIPSIIIFSFSLSPIVNKDAVYVSFWTVPIWLVDCSPSATHAVYRFRWRVIRSSFYLWPLVPDRRWLQLRQIWLLWCGRHIQCAERQFELRPTAAKLPYLLLQYRVNRRNRRECSIPVPYTVTWFLRRRGYRVTVVCAFATKWLHYCNRHSRYSTSIFTFSLFVIQSSIYISFNPVNHRIIHFTILLIHFLSISHSPLKCISSSLFNTNTFSIRV